MYRCHPLAVAATGFPPQVNFWDLSGQPEFVDVRNEFYKDAQGAILVYDVGNRRTFDALDSWMKEARKYGAKNAVIALCANKVRSPTPPRLSLRGRAAHVARTCRKAEQHQRGRWTWARSVL